MEYQHDPEAVATDRLMVAAIADQPYDNVLGYVVVAELSDGRGVTVSNFCCSRHAQELVLDMLDSSGPACTSPQTSLN